MTKFNHKIEIDLYEFVKTGKFNNIKTGQNREWILTNFPNPDDFENDDNWRSGEFEIFTYGDFELHFSNDILYLIFADFTGKIREGNSLLFTNKWIFKKDTSELNLAYVIEELKKNKIEFSTTKNDEFSITLKTIRNVRLNFESDDLNPLNYIFSAISVLDLSIISGRK